MARRRKNNAARKNNTDMTPEAIGQAVAAALESTNQKLDALINQQQPEGVKLDGDDLELMGVETPEELGEILNEAAEAAADALEQSGDPVAAAVIDAGLDTGDVVEELVKGRKSRKSAGEELDAVTVEEAAEVIKEVAAEVAAELSDEDVQQLVDDGYLAEDEAKESPEGDGGGTKRRGKGAADSKSGPRGKKSAPPAGHRTKQANTPPFQRRYDGLYLGRKSNQEEREQKELPKEARIGRAVKCSDYFARGGLGGGFADPERAAWAAEKFYKDARLAREFKAMTVTQPNSAGVLVPIDYVSDVIEMLYNQTVIFELGAQKIAMPHGNLSIPRQSTGARAYFVGEARPIKASKPTFDMLKLSAKQLAAMVPATEQLLRSTDISSDMIFGRDLMNQMKEGIDYSSFFGPGTEYAPLGLYYNKKVELLNLLTLDDVQIADSQGRPTADLPIFVRGKVRKKNVMGRAFGWVFNSDAEQYFMRMKTDSGDFIWKEEMDKGTFNGNPYRTTNMIPTDMNKGTTTLFFGDWNDFLVGDQFGLETRTSYDATYMGENGPVNAFETVQTVTRATMYVDMGNRHDESFIKVSNVKVFG